MKDFLSTIFTFQESEEIPPDYTRLFNSRLFSISTAVRGGEQEEVGGERKKLKICFGKKSKSRAV